MGFAAPHIIFENHEFKTASEVIFGEKCNQIRFELDWIQLQAKKYVCELIRLDDFRFALRVARMMMAAIFLSQWLNFSPIGNSTNWLDRITLNWIAGGGGGIDHNSTQFNTIQLFFCFWSWLASPEHDGKWPPTATKPNPQKSKLAPWNWPIIDPNYHLIIIVNNNKYHTHTHTKHADNYYYMRNDELDWFQRVSLDWINRHWAKIIF